MGVIVQKMIQAEVSGILFTINPIDNDKKKMSVECILGLGEPIVNGELNPDTYIVEKESGEIIEKKILPQEWMLVRKGRTKKGEDPNVKVKVSEIWKVRQKLESKYIDKLVKIGSRIEEYFKSPQEIEWAYEGGRIWIVQAREITTLKIEDESGLGNYDSFIDPSLDLDASNHLHAGDELSEFMDKFVDFYYENLETVFPKPEDAKIADVVLTLFKNREDLPIINKKAIYIYIKEQLDVKTVDVTKITKQLGQFYKEAYLTFLEHGLIKFKIK